jgi:hypothetical protein
MKLHAGEALPSLEKSHTTTQPSYKVPGIEAACGKLRQVRFRWRGGGGCTVEETVCARQWSEKCWFCVFVCVDEDS